MEKRSASPWLFVIAAVVFVAGTIGAFVLADAYTAKFWLSYFACLIALCGLIFGIWQTSRCMNQPSAYLSTVISIIYVVFVAGATVLGNTLLLSATWFGVIQLIILALFIVMMIIGLSAHRSISSQRETTKRSVTYSRMDTERVKGLLGKVNELPEDSREDALTTLTKVEEKLRYSDPIPGNGTEKQAREMDNALNELEATMDLLLKGQTDMGALEQKADSAIQNIDAYNRAKMLIK